MHLVLPKTFSCAPNWYTDHREVINDDVEPLCKPSLPLRGLFSGCGYVDMDTGGRRSRRRPSASLHPSSGRCPLAPPIYGIMGDYGSPPGPSPASFLRGILRVLLSSMVTKKPAPKLHRFFYAFLRHSGQSPFRRYSTSWSS